MKLIRLLEQALSSLLLIGREALTISSWPLQNRLNPSLVPVSLRSILVLFPASRKALIASSMIGNTVLEPPILMLAALLPARWARESAWASGEVTRTAVNAAAI